MPGLGIPKALQEIGGKRGFHPAAPVGMIFIPPPGHRLAHPRYGDPVNTGLRDDIVANGFREDKPPIIWLQVAEGDEVTVNGTILKKGAPLLVCGDGLHRVCAGYEAELVLQKLKKIHKHEELVIPVLWFHGTEGEFHLLRQGEDSDPFKTRHKPSVVAANFIAACKHGVTLADCIARKPSDYDKGTVGALLRWRELPPEAAALFDAGRVELDEEGEIVSQPGTGKVFEVNINILPSLFDKVPHPEMERMTRWLAFHRKKRASAASRWLREEAQRQEEAGETVDEGAGAARRTPALSPEADSNRRRRPPRARGRGGGRGRRGG